MTPITALADLKKGHEALTCDRITVGLATCGISAGADRTLAAFQAANLPLIIENVGCLGNCYAEPIVTVRQDGSTAIYGHVTEDKVQKILDAIKTKTICKELFLGRTLEEIDFYKIQKRLLLANCGKINPLDIDQYVATGGYDGLAKALRKKPQEIIEDVLASGLRGRGGAGFPTGQKWRLIAVKTGKKILVCNGDEGDPGAFMNRTVMESDPFKLIEGMTIAAYAIGSDEGIIYTRAEYPLAVKTLRSAITIAESHNLLGKNILGIEGFNFNLRIVMGAGAFVCGEETALMNSVMGLRGQPHYKPPYPADKGIYGYPTNINNVSTLSFVPLIMSMGAKEFAKIGSEKSKGTAVLCLTGKINRTGVIEVPMGTPLREIIFGIAGGPPQGTTFKAVQCGGPAGGCVSEKYLDLPVDYESLLSIGAMMGSGGLVVLNSDSCMVDVAKFFMSFTRSESCGKCTPCREGTTRIWEILDKITKGLGTPKDIETLKSLSQYVKENSLCGLGQAAPNPILTTLAQFADEYRVHIEQKECPSHSCRNLVHYRINEKCTGCGNCARHCPVHCIAGRLKEKHVIDQSVCVRCGACYENCAFDAIDKG